MESLIDVYRQEVGYFMNSRLTICSWLVDDAIGCATSLAGNVMYTKILLRAEIRQLNFYNSVSITYSTHSCVRSTIPCLRNLEGWVCLTATNEGALILLGSQRDEFHSCCKRFFLIKDGVLLNYNRLSRSYKSSVCDSNRLTVLSTYTSVSAFQMAWNFVYTAN